MGSVTESAKKMKEYSAKVTATDPRFRNNIEVRHRYDGSVFKIHCGFVMEDPDDPQWEWLITEHFGDLVFAKDEITWVVLSKDQKLSGSKNLAKTLVATLLLVGGTILIVMLLYLQISAWFK